HARGSVAIEDLRDGGRAAVESRAQRRRVLPAGFVDRRGRHVDAPVVSARAAAAVILRRDAPAGRQTHAAHGYHQQRSEVRSHAHPPWLHGHRSGIGPPSFYSSTVDITSCHAQTCTRMTTWKLSPAAVVIACGLAALAACARNAPPPAGPRQQG